MIIELTLLRDNRKTGMIINNIQNWLVKDDKTHVFSKTGDHWEVKETPQQIQEMILLDEYAKVALMGSCANASEFLTGSDGDLHAKFAYDTAKAMIEARREALK